MIGVTALRRAPPWVSFATGSLAGALALSPPPARAGDGPRARTPALFDAAPCVVVIDRALEPSLHLEYSIPNEDLEKTDDEVSDGRTHQLLALARQSLALPLWLSDVDVSAAAAVGLLDADKLTPEDVLETHPAWTGRWLRITPDDARLPISFPVAAAGVDWSIADVAPGAYLIDGYTWDPVFNLHSLRWGLIKIVDGPAGDDADLPAALLERSAGALFVTEGEALTLTGCVDALPGTTARAAWAPATYKGEPDWQVFLDPAPVESGPLELEFTPPLGVGSQSVFVRLTLEDPRGREYVAYAPEPIAVLEQLDEETATSEADVTSDASGDGSGTASATGEGTETGAVEDPSSGCACRARETPPRSLAWALALPLLGRRRRRAAASSQRARG
ncbi:MAG: hypothetical protein H6713_13875 [Myxococcales bacterium]|nr:hypothetical protein [Myxococcales bacterium]